MDSRRYLDRLDDRRGIGCETGNIGRVILVDIKPNKRTSHSIVDSM